jgi:hypothetical protein
MTRIPIPAFDDLDLYTLEGRRIATQRVLDSFMDVVMKKIEADIFAFVAALRTPKNAYLVRRRLARIIIRHLEARDRE